MSKRAKILLSLVVLFLVTVFGLLLATPSPSELTHKQIAEGHQSMMEEAVEIISRLESNELTSEIDSVFSRETSEWRVSALQGETLTMVNIVMNDSRINYELHLTAKKRPGEEAEYVKYSIYQHP